MRMRRVLAVVSVVVLAAVAGLTAVPTPLASAAEDLPPQGVHARGDAPFHGSPAGRPSGDAPVAAMAPTRNGDGYWIAETDGTVSTFGAAPALGDPDDLTLSAPIVGMAATPSGAGYWLSGRDGGVFAYGDAVFRGSTGDIELNEPIVDIAAAPKGSGYWLVAEDGGVFAYGDATFHGSTGAMALASPIVGMSPTPTGRGYWLVASDGGVFAFGDATFNGSMGGTELAAPVVGMAARPSGGYWLVGADGGVFSFGGAPFFGTAAPASGVHTAGIIATATGEGYWLYESAALSVFPPLPAGSGAGRRIVYSNSMQRAWLVERGERVVSSYLVSGRRGYPAAGTYSVFSKSRYSSSGSLVLEYMVRFAHGSTRAVGFHAIPYYRNGKTIQSEQELGQYRSAGCVRQRLDDAARLWDFAPVGTTVVVLR